MTPKQVEAKVEKLFKKWRPLLGLSAWDIRRLYFDGPYLQPDGDVSTGSYACCSVSWPYMQATMHFGVDAMGDLDDRDLEVVVVHELAHILVNEMREDGIDHEERVTTTVAWALVRALYAEEYR